MPSVPRVYAGGTQQLGVVGLSLTHGLRRGLLLGREVPPGLPGVWVHPCSTAPVGGAVGGALSWGQGLGCRGTGSVVSAFSLPGGLQLVTFPLCSCPFLCKMRRLARKSCRPFSEPQESIQDFQRPNYSSSPGGWDRNSGTGLRRLLGPPSREQGDGEQVESQGCLRW